MTEVLIKTTQDMRLDLIFLPHKRGIKVNWDEPYQNLSDWNPITEHATDIIQRYGY